MISRSIWDEWSELQADYKKLVEHLEIARKCLIGITSCPACYGAAKLTLEKIKDDT